MNQPSDEVDRAVALAAMLRLTVNGLRPLLREIWAAVPPTSSPAARSRAEALADGDGDQWALIDTFSAATLSAALDTAESLGQIVPKPSGAIPAFTLARGLIEASAQGLWLLEPNVDTRERLRRVVNEAIYGYHEMGVFMAAVKRDVLAHAGLQQQTSDRVDPDMQGEVDELLEWGLSRGFERTSKSKGRALVPPSLADA